MNSPTKSPVISIILEFTLRRLVDSIVAGRSLFTALPARSRDVSVRRRTRAVLPGGRRPDRRKPRYAARRSCSARDLAIASPRSRISRPPCRSAWTRGGRASGFARRSGIERGGGKHRQPARPRQRRAGRARGQRSPGKGGRTARQRHPHRTDAQRAYRSHARRRPAARRAGAGACSAAGADFAHQDSRRPQHRRTATAAGRGGAARGRAARTSTFASPPCRPSTANPRSSACCRATAACSRSPKLGLARVTTSARSGGSRSAARHDRHHRPDRQRQDDDAGDDAVGAQHATRARS